MIQKYNFCNDDEFIFFDDEKTVKELLRHAFDSFGYYEPFGMESVTLFQAHHPKSNYGWFTTDVSKSCKEEIIGDKYWLCFAYYIPNVFYYAEGGWGHHMKELGNHPEIDNPVMLHIRFEEFDNTVVFNGNTSFFEVVDLFQSVGYIPCDANSLQINPINPRHPSYKLSITDELMQTSLTNFEKYLPDSVVVIDIEQ